MSAKDIRRCFQKLAFFAAILAIPAFAGGHGKGFTEVYAVGDSLTDTGNLAAILGYSDGPVLDLSGQPLGVVLKDGKLSNGSLAVENIADSFKHAEGATPSSAGGSNYAIAGALANTAFEAFAPFSLSGTDLLTQTRHLIAAGGGALEKEALAVVFIGSNDLFSAVRSVAAAPGALDVQGALAQSAANVAQTLRQLSDAGAENFLVFDAPDIGRTPAMQVQVQQGQLPPEALALARQLTLGFNARLLQEIRALGRDRQFEGRVWYFSTFAATEFIASPLGAKLFGFTSNTPCAPELGLGQSCASSTFWDFVHVTARVHEILADSAKILLQLPPLVRN
jgi:phospholipase/lecithinase/hemolysin